VLVLHRFRVPEAEAASFRVEVEAALAVLREQQGFGHGTIGRNVDDPELWVLETRWAGPGAYRRGLSAYDVKVGAWAVLGRAIDEASAYEVLDGGQEPNQARPRGTGDAGRPGGG
jgi:hypothetical protein